MVSLSYRSFENFILDDNLVGLRGFLDNRHVVVDDRDDVSLTLSHIDRWAAISVVCNPFLVYILWSCIYRTEPQPCCLHRSKAKVPSSENFLHMEQTQMPRIPYAIYIYFQSFVFVFFPLNAFFNQSFLLFFFIWCHRVRLILYSFWMLTDLFIWSIG